jgi:hypothetical protein
MRASGAVEGERVVPNPLVGAAPPQCAEDNTFHSDPAQVSVIIAYNWNREGSAFPLRLLFWLFVFVFVPVLIVIVLILIVVVFVLFLVVV